MLTNVYNRARGYSRADESIPRSPSMRRTVVSSTPQGSVPNNDNRNNNNNPAFSSSSSTNEYNRTLMYASAAMASFLAYVIYDYHQKLKEDQMNRNNIASAIASAEAPAVVSPVVTALVPVSGRKITNSGRVVPLRPHAIAKTQSPSVDSSSLATSTESPISTSPISDGDIVVPTTVSVGVAAPTNANASIVSTLTLDEYVTKLVSQVKKDKFTCCDLQRWHNIAHRHNFWGLSEADMDKRVRKEAGEKFGILDALTLARFVFLWNDFESAGKKCPHAATIDMNDMRLWIAL